MPVFTYHLFALKEAIFLAFGQILRMFDESWIQCFLKKKNTCKYQPYDKSLKKLLKKQINYRGKATLSFGIFPYPLLHRKMHFFGGQILRILAESWCHYLWVSALLSKTVERANKPYRFWNRHFWILKQKLSFSFLFNGFC